jgi:hypothetical protein
MEASMLLGVGRDVVGRLPGGLGGRAVVHALCGAGAHVGDVALEGLSPRLVARGAVTEGGEAVREAAHGAEREQDDEERSLEGMHEGLREWENE